MGDGTGLITLGIETSCDETSAAVLRGESELLGHVIHSQDVHRLYGGVVPEIASRAHLRALDDVVDAALREADVGLDEIDLVGVTAGPGLIGALLVGVSWGKGMAWALDIPIVGVHHMEAHLFAARLENDGAEPPFIALLVSGGHTMLLRVPEWGEYHLLGSTRDDAAGEAFDKAAKLLSLPYPGGPAIQARAAEGDPRRYRLPRPLLTRKARPDDAAFYDFSFSGLKTALREKIAAVSAEREMDEAVADLAAAFQDSVVDVLATKTLRAVEEHGYRRVVLGGGVANSRPLRDEIRERLGDHGELYAPSPRLSTDNAAMIARTAVFRYGRGERADLDLNAHAALPFPGLAGSLGRRR